MTARKKPAKLLPLCEPRNLSQDAWFYNERYGLRVLVRLCSPDNAYLGTTNVLVPWRVFKREQGQRQRNALPRRRAKAGKGARR